MGLVYGLSLALLNEMLLFAGQIAGLQFSFSLVNLMDPASAIQTPLLGDLFQLMGTLVLIAAGLDRILLASMVRSFRAVPLGSYRAGAGRPRWPSCARPAASFWPRVELAAPVLAATMLVEIAVALLGKLSPQLPVMLLTVPLKTLTGFAILTGSLALWPRFIEARFAGLLDMAERLISCTGRTAGIGRLADARRAHRTGHPAPARKGAQGRRHPAQPRADGRGGNAGRRDGAGRAGRPDAWRRGASAFAAFLALGAAGALGAGDDGADAGGDAAADARGAGAAGRGDGGGGRGGAGRGHCCRPAGVTVHAGAIGFKLERINPVANVKNLFSLRAAARLGKSLIPASLAGGVRRAAHRAAADDSAVFDRAAGAAGLGCLRTAAGRGLAALRLVGDRLPGGVAEPRIAPEDEPRRICATSSRRPKAARRFAAASAACSARCAAAG